MTGITKPTGNDGRSMAASRFRSVTLTDTLQTFTVNRALQ